MINEPAEERPSILARAKHKTKSLVSKVKDNASFASTESGRNAVRYNAGSQLIGFASYSTYALMAIVKVSQVVVSFFILTRGTPRASEKLLYLILAGLAAVQFALIATLFIEQYCFNIHTNGVWSAYAILDWIFVGILISGWIPSEFSKLYDIDPTNSNPPQPASEGSVDVEISPPDNNGVAANSSLRSNSFFNAPYSEEEQSSAAENIEHFAIVENNVFNI